MATIRKQTEIQSAVIYRVTCKATREVFYRVASDSKVGEFYDLHFSHQTLSWECPCESRKPCKHQRAVNQVLAAKREMTAVKLGGDMPEAVAELQAREDRKLAQAEIESSPEYRAELAQATIAAAEAALAEARARSPKYAPTYVGGFNRRGASCYISDAEMAALKNVVAARKTAKEQATPARQYEDWSSPTAPIYTTDRRQSAPLNPNAGFQFWN